MSSDVVFVRKFYEGKSVLITGGTGSIGKLLVQKLLKSCPNIGRIYLLIRPKKGKTTAQRILSVLDTPIFKDLKESNLSVLSNIVAVEGNLCEEGLGLSTIDRETLIEEVAIVFHCAATLRFDMSLEDAIESNVFGTRNLLEVCCRMTKIEAFVHVSTLYSTCNKPMIKERIPSIPALNGNLNFAESIENFVAAIPQEVSNDWTNTYTFSKALAEMMLNEYKDALPISIVRPSIILSTAKEPMAGWIDNYYGPTLAVISGGLGILRSLIIAGDTSFDIIPSDFVVNSMICIGSKTKYRETNEITVYNCCTGRRNVVKKGPWMESCKRYTRLYPFMSAIGYPNTTIRTSCFTHWLITTVQSQLLHILDFIAYCASKKSYLSRMHQKVNKIQDLQEFFCLRGWQVMDHNLEKLGNELSEEEREIFYMDPKLIDWDSYTKNYILGIRKYLLSEDPDNMQAAIARMNKLYWIERSLQFFVFVGSVTLLYYCIRWIAPLP